MLLTWRGTECVCGPMKCWHQRSMANTGLGSNFRWVRRNNCKSIVCSFIIWILTERHHLFLTTWHDSTSVINERWERWCSWESIMRDVSILGGDNMVCITHTPSDHFILEWMNSKTFLFFDLRLCNEDAIRVTVTCPGCRQTAPNSLDVRASTTWRKIRNTSQKLVK